MKKWQRIVALAAVFAMTITMVSCKPRKQDFDMSTPMTVSLMHMEGGNAPFDPEWEMLKYIKREKNVDMNMIVVPGADYNQKRTVVLASGEIPDIVVNTWPSEMGQYANAGILLPVSDYLDQLPDLDAFIKKYDLEATVKNISEPDGKFYVLPDMRKSLSGTQTFSVRQDVFDELGIALPETYEELLEAMIKIKKAYPNSLGTGELYKGNEIMSFMAEAWNTNGGFSLPFGYCYDFDKQEWYFAPTSEQYKDLLTFMNKMYVNGALDPEAFTQDAKAVEQKILNNQYMVWPDSGPSSAASKQASLHKLGNTKAKVTALKPLAGPEKYGSLRKVKPSSRNQGGNAMPATVANRPDFDRFMDFINWFYYSEQNVIATKFGWEGITYDIIDGEYVMRPEIKTGVNPAGEIQLTPAYGVGALGFMTLLPDNLPEKLQSFTQNKDQYEFGQYIKDNNMTTEDDPIVKFTPEQSEEVTLLVTTLKDYFTSMAFKFIFNQEPLANWDAYVQQCNAKGATRLMEIVDEAWASNQS